MSFRTSVTKVEPPWQPLRQSTGTLPQGNTDTDSNALVTSLGICGKDRHEVDCLSVWSSGSAFDGENSKCAGVLVLMGPDCSSPEQNTFSLQDVAGEHFQPNHTLHLEDDHLAVTKTYVTSAIADRSEGFHSVFFVICFSFFLFFNVFLFDFFHFFQFSIFHFVFIFCHCSSPPGASRDSPKTSLFLQKS